MIGFPEAASETSQEFARLGRNVRIRSSWLDRRLHRQSLQEGAGCRAIGRNQACEN